MKYPCKAIVIATEIEPEVYAKNPNKFPNIGDNVILLEDYGDCYKFDFNDFDGFSWYKWKFRVIDFEHYLKEAEKLGSI